MTTTTGIYPSVTITNTSGTTYPYTIKTTDNTSGGIYTYTGNGSYTNTEHKSIIVKGDAEFEGDLKIKGKSLVNLLEKMEEKLAILHPNLELEEKWEQLRELRKAYMELEAEIKEKELIWATLKK